MRTCFLILLSFFFPVWILAQPHFISIEPQQTDASQNEIFELNIQLTTSAANVYNFNEIRLFGIFTAPDGTVFEQDGFYYQHFTSQKGQLVPSGAPYWKIRFTPQQTGAWTYNVKVIDQQGFDLSETFNFQCLTSTVSSFVAFQNGSRFLTDDEGNTVFLIGENIAWADYQSGNDRMHEFMQGLSASGANFAKLMMVPWSYSIEWGSGGLMNYTNRMDRAFMVDSTFRMSRDYGLYLQLAFSIHDELKNGYAGEDWLSNSYNIINGGPCTEPMEFFTNTEAKDAFKNRMRYISARWGSASRLFGWELLSEADNFPFYNANKTLIAAWAAEMASWLSDHDPYSHPVSVGFALTTSNPEVWSDPAIGFSQLHYYSNGDDIEGEAFRMIGVYRDSYQKPVLVGEYGIGYVMDSIIAQDPQGWALHNGLWTSAMAGSLGSVVPWYWDAYIHALNLYYRFSGISAFMKDESLAENNPQPLHIESESIDNIDFVVHPKFTTFNEKAPSGIFQLKTTGLLIPAEDSLGAFLYGPNSVFSDQRNPPIFHGVWPETTFISIETGSQVISGKLQLMIDGTVVFEQSVTAGSIYQIPIPSGEHSFRIDNIGTSSLSIIELKDIIFSKYLPKLRAFGLFNNSRTLVWVHNRNNNWKWYRQNNQAPEAVSGTLLLPYYSGIYKVDIYNTTSGLSEESIEMTATDTGLLIPIEGLSTDLALKISIITGLSEQKLTEPDRPLVYPNPTFNEVTFSIQTKSGEFTQLEIFDILGRMVYSERMVWPSSGSKQIIWDTNATSKISGIYAYRFRTGNKQFTGKLVVE